MASTRFPRILITAPVHNREWILPWYLHHLDQLNYNKKKLEFFFVVNNCTDRTEEMLRAWPGAVVEVDDDNFPPDLHRGMVCSNQSIYGRLSRLRNHCIDYFLNHTECSKLLFIDSDVLVPSLLIRTLLSTSKSLIAGWLSNHPTGDKTISNAVLLLPIERGLAVADSHTWVRIYPEDDNDHRVVEVSITGAVFMIDRQVVENNNIRYASIFGGTEDEGFCGAALAAGHKLYVTLAEGARCNHIMLQHRLPRGRCPLIYDNHTWRRVNYYGQET